MPAPGWASRAGELVSYSWRRAQSVSTSTACFAGEYAPNRGRPARAANRKARTNETLFFEPVERANGKIVKPAQIRRYTQVIVITEYIEQRDGGLYIFGSRVSLDSVVYAFLRGESPEGIAESFPALGLDQIFGALAFYVANREMVDRHLSENQHQFETLREQSRQQHPALYAKLIEARHKIQAQQK